MARILLTERPKFPNNGDFLYSRGTWPASWVDHPQRPLGVASLTVFKLNFTVDVASVVRIHVSADNRYQLCLDGVALGYGPERGAPNEWHYESYELELQPGSHMLTALTWWLGADAPWAQMTVRPGFLLAGEGEWDSILSTGIAPWKVMLADGYSFVKQDIGTFNVTGARATMDAAQMPWGWQTGAGAGYVAATIINEAISSGESPEWNPHWLLSPALLPAMYSAPVPAGLLRRLEVAGVVVPINPEWEQWVAGANSITVAAQQRAAIVIDLGRYYCNYPTLSVNHGKGTRITFTWAESLFDNTTGFEKGQRDAVEGKYFRGQGDTYLPDGELRAFTPLWWGCGRFIELRVTTGDEALDLLKLELQETRYPLEMQGTLAAAGDRFANILALGLRALQMCSHETYMDCPYYEQLMYVGDTRLEVLTTYVISRDDLLPRKAISTFNQSHLPSGLTQSRYPSARTQVIPPFSLWWVGLVHDYWRWRDDPAFVAAQMPGVRTTLEYFRTLLRPDKLIGAPVGWNFVDWVPGWYRGMPPGADTGVSSIVNLQFVYALQQKAELETWLQEPELATRDRALAGAILQAVIENYYDTSRGLIADDPSKTSFSEHAQCLALLCDNTPHAETIAENLLTAPDLARATVYFSHYLFEAYAKIGRIDRLFTA
ncbi:MAG: alpha-L-rhamnosidase, partial [bacterium]